MHSFAAAALSFLLLMQAAPVQKTEYVCPPCGCSLDTQVFDAPGTCSACQMALVKTDAPQATVRTRRDPGPSDLYGVRIRKVKDGVLLASRPDPLRTFVEGNVTIIINDEDVVVVDAGGAPIAARNIIAEIRKLTPKPVRYVINTHFH